MKFILFLIAVSILLSVYNAEGSGTINVVGDVETEVQRIIARPINNTNFGGELIGIDIEHITDEEFDLLHNALLQYKVLAVRGQSSLSIDGQRAFTRRFGNLQVHIESASHFPGYPDVNVVSNIKGEGGSYIGLYGKHVESFHSDLSWANLPTKVTVVKSVIRPDNCGHTEFSDGNAVFRALSKDMQDYLKSKTAKYCYLKTRTFTDGNKVEGLTEEQVSKALNCAVHPLVISHPETKLPFIFANPSHTTTINDAHPIESEYILNMLFDISSRKENMYAHYYEEGDLVIWDNRAVQHRATGCPDEFPRKLVRTTAECDVEPSQI